MERKSFLGLVIGVIVGLVLLFLVYFLFFQNSEVGNNLRNTIGNFFPTGGDAPQPIDTDGDSIPDTIVDEHGNTTVFIPKLRRLSITPVAGYIAFDRATSTLVTFGTTTKMATTTQMITRYVEKATGHVYETEELTLKVPRLSNTTLGIFDEVTFSNSQSFVARKFNSDSALIDTYIGSLVRVGTSTPDLKTTGVNFPRNPDMMAVRGTSLFALYEYPLNSEGFVTQTAPIREVKVFFSPLSGWNAEWINKDQLLLTTKASMGYEGNAYLFNPTTKAMREIYTGKPGLTARINNNATAGIYTESYNNQLLTFISDFTKKTFFQLSSVTLPEKCVFSQKNPMIAYCAVPRPLPKGVYPDDWYKGKVQFDDAIVQIDFTKNIETPVVNLAQEGGVSIDAINLSLNEKETHIVFQNKRDNYVWSYDLR